MNAAHKRFIEAYKNNLWAHPASRSGPGSSLEQTGIIRVQIPLLLSQFGVKTMLDIPCGDFHWMKEIRVELGSILSSYVGGDIVADLIQQNTSRHADAKFTFELLDVTKDKLPKCDLVMIRDCFIHLGDEMIADAISNAQKSGITYLLASTYTNPNPNRHMDGVSLSGRGVNLCLPPFSFPDPLKLINEGSTEPRGEDKSLGLWKLEDIDVEQIRRRIRLRAPFARIGRIAVRVGRALKRRTSISYWRNR